MPCPVPSLLRAAVLVVAAAVPAAGQTLDAIRERGEIRLGHRTDAAPLSHVDAEGAPAGYTVAICEGVADRLQAALGLETLERRWLAVDVADRFEAVADGRIDLLCGAATITLDRRETVDFSLPVFVDGTAVLLPAGADPEIGALDGKRAGVRAGTTTETILGNSLEALGIAAEVVPFDGHDAGLAALETGEIDAYFGDQSILYALYFASDAAGGLVISDNTLTVEKQGLALRRGDSDFRLAVDRAVSDLYASGEIARIFEEAFPGATPGVALKALLLLGPDLP